jgi:hypothetical protein
VAVALVAAGLLASAAAHRDNEAIVLELWWAPLVCALLLLSMAPYCDLPCMLLSGFTLLLAALGAAALLDVGASSAWPPLAATIMIVSPVVFGTAGAVAFIVTVTRRLTRWSERPWMAPPAAARDHEGDPEGPDALVAQVDEQTSAQLAEALGLLADIVARGEVDDRDQASAARIAGRLRGELIAAANDSWLERMARGRPLSVRDPDRLADRLGLPQRTALRAMLDALLDDPASGFVSARIELRSPVEGTIAVALRILTTLAEGRRVTFLEPYYVSLQSTVTGIRWRNGSSIALDFTTATEPPSPQPPLAQRQAQLPE